MVRRIVFLLLISCACKARAQRKSACILDSITMHQVREGKNTTFDQTNLRGHILDSSGSWIGLVDPHKHFWSCIDGRSKQGVIGTPGGDMGEFLLGLTIYNNNSDWLMASSDSELTYQRIQLLFEDFMLMFNGSREFYYHSDGHALEHLEHQVAEEIPDLEEFDLLSVPEAYRSQVLELLVEPLNIGCGHIQQIMASSEYLVPQTLTEGLIRAYFQHLWTHETHQLNYNVTDYELLDGSHHESAVLNIYLEGSCGEDVPLLVPTTNTCSAFINYPRQVKKLRSEIASFFLSQAGMNNISFEEFLAQADELAEIQLSLTLEHFASNDPIENITITIHSSNDTNLPSPTPNSTPATTTSSSPNNSFNYSTGLLISIAVGVTMGIVLMGIAVAVWKLHLWKYTRRGFRKLATEDFVMLELGKHAEPAR